MRLKEHLTVRLDQELLERTRRLVAAMRMPVADTISHAFDAPEKKKKVAERMDDLEKYLDFSSMSRDIWRRKWIRQGVNEKENRRAFCSLREENAEPRQGGTGALRQYHFFTGITVCRHALESEARLLSQIGSETVTVSELVRSCITEKFPEVGAKKLRESQALVGLHQEVSQLKERHGLLARDVEKLVQTLAEMFPLLATREQVESLTDGIAAVIRSLKGR